MAAAKSCMMIAWSATDKSGNPRPFCPQCGKPGELNLIMGIKIGYTHKRERSEP